MGTQFGDHQLLVDPCRTSGVWWPTPTGPCCCWRISPFGASSDRPKDEWPHAPRRIFFRHGMGSKKGGSGWRSGKIWSCQKSTSLIASKILLMNQFQGVEPSWTQAVFFCSTFYWLICRSITTPRSSLHPLTFCAARGGCAQMWSPEMGSIPGIGQTCGPVR